MKKIKLYVDTSVISFCFASDAPELQKITLDFFDKDSVYYDLFISNIVLLEINKTPDALLKNQLLGVVEKYPFNIISQEHNDEIQELAKSYISSCIIPPNKIEDALHVALATFHQLDILLSWNFKHLANINKETKIISVNTDLGYRHPLRLLSPLEVSHER